MYVSKGNVIVIPKTRITKLENYVSMFGFNLIREAWKQTELRINSLSAMPYSKT